MHFRDLPKALFKWPPVHLDCEDNHQLHSRLLALEINYNPMQLMSKTCARSPLLLRLDEDHSLTPPLVDCLKSSFICYLCKEGVYYLCGAYGEEGDSPQNKFLILTSTFAYLYNSVLTNILSIAFYSII